MPSSTTKWIEREMSNRNLFNQMRSFLLFVFYFVGDDNVIQEMNESMLMQSKQCKKISLCIELQANIQKRRKICFSVSFFFSFLYASMLFICCCFYIHTLLCSCLCHTSKQIVEEKSTTTTTIKRSWKKSCSQCLWKWGEQKSYCKWQRICAYYTRFSSKYHHRWERSLARFAIVDTIFCRLKLLSIGAMRNCTIRFDTSQNRQSLSGIFFPGNFLPPLLFRPCFLSENAAYYSFM